MTPTTDAQIEALVNGLYCRGLNDARPDYYKTNGTEITRQEACKLIQALLLDARIEEAEAMEQRVKAKVDELEGDSSPESAAVWYAHYAAQDLIATLTDHRKALGGES